MTDRFSFDELVSGQLDRRQFLSRLAAAGLVVTGVSGCGGVEGTARKTTSTAPAATLDHAKADFDGLNISNWPLYIDKKVVKDFEKEFSVDITYKEDVNDNEEFFGKVRQPLAQNRPTGRDLFVLTDWMAARMIRLGYVQQLDKKNIPNAANLQDGLKSPAWDPERAYSLPWQSGMTAIGYNKARTGREIKSINDLFDPKFKGRVSLLSDAREAANLILLRDGKRPEDATIEDALAAIDVVDEENRKGQIRRFTGNDYTTDLSKGNLWVAQVYSGDLIQLQADNPDLQFVIPEEGATLWSDNMQIPQNAERVYGAEVWMNYVYDPVVAAKIAAYVNYVTPVKGAREELAKTDPKTAENPLIFPDDATLAQLHPYVDLDEDEERRLNEKMATVVGA